MFSIKISLFLFLSSVLFANSFSYPNVSEALKEKKLYPMGKKIYSKVCNNLDVSTYSSYEQVAKAVDSGVCTKLSAKHSQALSLYIWDVKRVGHKEYAKITVTKKDKCQVCGMYLYHYPNWVSRINYPKGETYSFDGIKDMMKFYYNNEEGIVDILVQDYYTLKTLNAREAFYVLGSDVYGPMGNELIAFKTLKSAKTFSLEHKGKSPLHFDELNEKMVRNLDK